MPATVVHWVEHHTDLGHHDEETGHHHDEHGDHDPFGCDEHGTCTTFTMVGMMQEPRTESDDTFLYRPSCGGPGRRKRTRRFLRFQVEPSQGLSWSTSW